MYKSIIYEYTYFQVFIFYWKSFTLLLTLKTLNTSISISIYNLGNILKLKMNDDNRTPTIRTQKVVSLRTDEHVAHIRFPIKI